MEAFGFSADARLGEGEVNRHWQLWVIGKKRCQLQGQGFRLKQILFLTFLLFSLLSLGNFMVPIYTLITHKAKPLTHTSLLRSRPGPCIKPAGHLCLDVSWP